MSSPRVLLWHRTDLRLHDSPALHAALALYPSVLYPVWTWDPHYVYSSRVGPNRWQYLLDCQTDLSRSMTALNPKQKLLVVRESPISVLPKLFKAWRITHLVFEKDPDVYAMDRDEKVRKSAVEAGVEVVTKYGRTLWDTEEIVSRCPQGTWNIATLMKTAKAIGSIPHPLAIPKHLPDPGATDLQDVPQALPQASPDLNASLRNEPDKAYAVGLAGPNGDFSIPTMSELSLPTATTPHRGGETIALAALDSYLANETQAATFSKPSTAPTVFSPPSTTLLSPHLHFGTLSVRHFYWQVQNLLSRFQRAGKRISQPPTSLHGQLFFREMYFAAYLATGSVFCQTLGNKNCRYIDWHLPSPYSASSTLPDDKVLLQKQEHLARWRAGTTGFPWIDAIMRQLRTEGWIHHLARHAVASFLTRGGLYISWERGAEVFEEYLIDHEVACNVGNWQWLSCTAFFSEYWRVYNPVTYGKGTDREGAFVRRYVEELRDVEGELVWEPWKDADVWRRVNSRGYPERMVDWGEARRECMSGMKRAFRAGMKGNDEMVLESGHELERVMKVVGEGINKEENEKKRKAPSKGKAGRAKKLKLEKGQKTLDAFTKR